MSEERITIDKSRYNDLVGRSNRLLKLEQEGLYTEEEVVQLLQSEAQLILKGLLRNLTEVRAQRGAERISLPEGRDQQLKRMGEIDGLNIAIAAVRRRIR